MHRMPMIRARRAVTAAAQAYSLSVDQTAPSGYELRRFSFSRRGAAWSSVVVLVVVGAVCAGWWNSTRPPGHGAGGPSAPTATAETMRVNGYRLAFKYPANWHTYPANMSGSMASLLLYVSSAP